MVINLAPTSFSFALQLSYLLRLHLTQLLHIFSTSLRANEISSGVRWSQTHDRRDNRRSLQRVTLWIPAWPGASIQKRDTLRSEKWPANTSWAWLYFLAEQTICSKNASYSSKSHASLSSCYVLFCHQLHLCLLKLYHQMPFLWNVSYQSVVSQSAASPSAFICTALHFYIIKSDAAETW